MKLSAALEIAEDCGLGNETLGCVYDNISMHATMLFVYTEMHDEVEELATELWMLAMKHSGLPETKENTPEKTKAFNEYLNNTKIKEYVGTNHTTHKD